MPWYPNLWKAQFLTATVCYAGKQDPSVPSVWYNNSNHKDSEQAQGPVRPLIIAINAVLHEENTYPRNKKKSFKNTLCPLWNSHRICTILWQLSSSFPSQQTPPAIRCYSGHQLQARLLLRCKPPTALHRTVLQLIPSPPRGKCSSDPASCWGYSFAGEPPGLPCYAKLLQDVMQLSTHHIVQREPTPGRQLRTVSDRHENKPGS